MQPTIVSMLSSSRSILTVEFYQFLGHLKPSSNCLWTATSLLLRKYRNLDLVSSCDSLLTMYILGWYTRWLQSEIAWVIVWNLCCSQMLFSFSFSFCFHSLTGCWCVAIKTSLKCSYCYLQIQATCHKAANHGLDQSALWRHLQGGSLWKSFRLGGWSSV